ncbi:MAG: sulfite exporter TauE/SafE family protein [Gammaproteobacteria bacterium]|nr:MAG: sulfite exporter TauE/SafE family protein [Gammaproteobacteria bacterium]
MDTYLLYLCLGAIAGVISGLFGLGGGVVIVPILIFTFTAQAISPDVLTHLAIGTSLATIVVTSISSVSTHHRHGAVLWPVALWLTPGICLGAALGAVFAISITGATLQLAFGVFLCLVALKMAFPINPDGGARMPGGTGKTLVGSVIGFVSSLFGIGGGSLTVPFLTWVHVPMKNAVATSAACGLPIAVSGAVTYLWKGYGETGLPAGALGFVYLPAFIGIVLTSTIFARLGARWAHRLPGALLSKGFAVLLLVIGLRFVWRNIGVIAG